jgi:hypothetical protein
MHSLVRDFDVVAADVAATIDATGCACIRDVVSDEWLHSARMRISSYLPLNGDNELFVINPAADPDSVAHELLADDRLQSLLESVAVVGFPALDVDNHNTENELRIVVGSGMAEPKWLHYDGPVVTIVVPIVIPEDTPGNSGELILWPNRRPYRRFVLTNIVEKFVCQNGLYRKWFVRRHGGDAVTVPLEPGHMYVFWGYRSYHATLPVPRRAVRATLVLHYGAVYGRSPILAIAKSVNQRIRAWRGKSNIARSQDLQVPAPTRIRRARELRDPGSTARLPHPWRHPAA